MKKLSILIILIFIGVIPVSAQPKLPQNHPWEVTLRNYMAKLDTNDFHVDIKPLTFNSSWTTSADTLYKWWVAINHNPGFKELFMNPKYLTLSSFEDASYSKYIHMRVGGGWGGPYSVIDVSFWALFNYPGNPYYNSRAVKLRALVPAMLDMMMYTHDYEQGANARSDFAGGDLIKYAYTYYHFKNVLPDSVQKAYETGMLNIMRQIEQWGPTGTFGDMDGFASVGMWYVAKALNDPQITQEAKDYTDRLIKLWFHNAGYNGHGTGFDATYDGIDLFFYSWAARISDYKPLNEIISKILKLKGYLMVQDPGGYWNGPSHFSTATNASVGHDQWNNYTRDVSDAMISDYGLFLLENTSHATNRRSSRLRTIPDYNFMIQAQGDYISMGDEINHIDQSISGENTYNPPTWQENHWVSGSASTNYFYETYEPGFYNRILQLKNENSPLLQAPFQRKKNFIKVFSNNVTYPDSCTFVSAKLGGYGAIIHTGNLSDWGKSDGTGALSGLSGGTLSTFWTPSAGTVINGIAGGFQSGNASEQDTWNNWQQWAVNTITGVTSSGQPFSEARDRYPKAICSVNSDSTSATVVAKGVISSSYDGGRTAPNGAIQGKVNYTRKFEVNPSGVTVTSTIASDGKDQIKSLWEMIPVFLKNLYNAFHNKTTIILFQVNNKWVAGTTNLTQNVTAIQLQRFSGAVNITFDSPQSVKLSAPRFIHYQVLDSTQNIMIDLLHNNGQAVSFPKQVSVSYTIAPTLEKSTPINQSSGSNLPSKIELKQNYPNPFNPTTNIAFQLASTTPVTLQIFNILGQLVSSPLHNQVMEAGEHHIQFDGSNLSSGVYIYRLKTKTAIREKKMMLIK